LKKGTTALAKSCWITFQPEDNYTQWPFYMPNAYSKCASADRTSVLKLDSDNKAALKTKDAADS